MTQYITMKQLPGGTVTATDDRILWDVNLQSGIIEGCEISYLGNNMIHIDGGYGVIKGGLFQMEDHTEYVDLAESDNTTGQIYLKLDLSADDKLQIICETAASLHPMTQELDANFTNGVYEFQLCTYTATTTALEDVTQTFPNAKGAIDLLGTEQELMSNTTPGKIPDALIVKGINSNLSDFAFRVDTDTSKPQYSSDGGTTWANFSSGVSTRKILFTPHDSTVAGNVIRVKSYDDDNNLLVNFITPISAGNVSFEFSNLFKGQYGNNDIIFTFLASCIYDGVHKNANDSVVLIWNDTTEHTVIFDD